jgi:hypothetical protein
VEHRSIRGCPATRPQQEPEPRRRGRGRGAGALGGVFALGRGADVRGLLASHRRCAPRSAAPARAARRRQAVLWKRLHASLWKRLHASLSSGRGAGGCCGGRRLDGPRVRALRRARARRSWTHSFHESLRCLVAGEELMGPGVQLHPHGYGHGFARGEDEVRPRHTRVSVSAVVRASRRVRLVRGEGRDVSSQYGREGEGGGGLGTHPPRPEDARAAQDHPHGVDMRPVTSCMGAGSLGAQDHTHTPANAAQHLHQHVRPRHRPRPRPGRAPRRRAAARPPQRIL